MALFAHVARASRPSSSSAGAALTFETVVAGEQTAPLRLRPEADTLLRVVSGLLRLEIEGIERVLDAGDEAIVPAGSLHRIDSVYGEARFMTGLRPAG